MSYEAAPATTMLATHCAICNRPLLDAFSVEVAIGPICRQRHGYDEELAALGEDARVAANRIIHQIAVHREDEQLRADGCAALRVMGFKKLPDRIEYRGKDAPKGDGVVIEEHVLPPFVGRWRTFPAVTGYLVRAPYRPSAVAAFRNIPGRRWLREAKATFVPAGERKSLWQLLKVHYAGLTITTASGTTVIPTV
jgi:hypothetical protein